MFLYEEVVLAPFAAPPCYFDHDTAHHLVLCSLPVLDEINV